MDVVARRALERPDVEAYRAGCQPRSDPCHDLVRCARSFVGKPLGLGAGMGARRHLAVRLERSQVLVGSAPFAGGADHPGIW